MKKLTQTADQKLVVNYMKESKKVFNSSLAFFNDWDMYWSGESGTHTHH